MHIPNLKAFAILAFSMLVLGTACNFPAHADPGVGQDSFVMERHPVQDCITPARITPSELVPAYADSMFLTQWVGDTSVYAWFDIVVGGKRQVLADDATGYGIFMNVGSQLAEQPLVRLDPTTPNEPIKLSMEASSIPLDATLEFWINPVATTTATLIRQWKPTENVVNCI